MELWVVAAAAAVGYLAEYWHKLFGDKARLSESSSRDLISGISEPTDLIRSKQDQASSFRSLNQKRLLTHVSSDGKNLPDQIASGMGRFAGEQPQKFDGKQNFQGNLTGISEKDEPFDCSYYFLNQSRRKKTGFCHLRSELSHGNRVKPSSSLENSRLAQLYSEHVKMEEHAFKKGKNDSFKVKLAGEEVRLGSKTDACLQENIETLLRAPLSSQWQHIRSVELPRKPKQRRGTRRFSGRRPYLTQGSPNGVLLFFIGITIGLMSNLVASKREVEKLNEQLKQTQILVQDLHEELEMKEMVTVDDNFQSNIAYDHYLRKRDAHGRSFESELGEFNKYDIKKPNNKTAENHELISKIEAELEAELEKLELNMNVAAVERVCDFVEADPNFEADVSKGDIKLDWLDNDSSETTTHQTHTTNCGVSPRELSLRLHEVIESRLEERIEELEAALEGCQKEYSHSLEFQNLTSPRDCAFGPKIASSSGSPILVAEENYTDQL